MNEQRFDNKGKVYAQFRPDYSTQFIEYLYTEVGLQSGSVIADIGAGTGILTRQLLHRGSSVYAVEPNDDMRSAVQQGLKQFDGLHLVCASAESTGIDGGTIDFVTVGQAYHWFDRKRFQDECKRILRPGGKVILVWNDRDAGSDLIAANALINTLFCPGFKGFGGYLTQAERANDFTDFFTGDYDVRVFENDVMLDQKQFIGRNLSSSYAPRESDKNYQTYVDAVQELFDGFSKDGRLAYPYKTCSYVGRV